MIGHHRTIFRWYREFERKYFTLCLDERKATDVSNRGKHNCSKENDWQTSRDKRPYTFLSFVKTDCQTVAESKQKAETWSNSNDTTKNRTYSRISYQQGTSPNMPEVRWNHQNPTHHRELLWTQPQGTEYHSLTKWFSSRLLTSHQWKNYFSNTITCNSCYIHGSAVSTHTQPLSIYYLFIWLPHREGSTIVNINNIYPTCSTNRMDDYIIFTPTVRYINH